MSKQTSATELNIVVTMPLQFLEGSRGVAESESATLLIQRGELAHLPQFANCVMGRR